MLDILCCSPRQRVTIGVFHCIVVGLAVSSWMTAGHALAQQASSPATQPARIDRAQLGGEVRAILQQHGGALQASLWIGGASGDAWYELEPAVARPAASSIKSFYLVELFDRYKRQLDEPPPGLERLLKDDQHLAFSHFTPEQREEIRREMNGASVRRVGEMMMGQTKVSNVVYNAAANVTTALLGGPEALTQAIHKRHAAFQGVAARRYMLRDRKSPGDNEVTAASFAALYQSLAVGKLEGIDAPTLKAIRAALLRSDDPKLGRHYNKGGSLGTDPVTLVHAGWWETPNGTIVYVIMTDQPAPKAKDSEAIANALARTVNRLEALLVGAGRRALSR